MRSRKASPADRASTQAISAVRRLPTCNEPVGDGAKRPGIGDSVPSACGRPARSLRLDHMQCHVCGTEVRPEHKFCMECGARLKRLASELALAPPHADEEETSRLPALAAPSSHPMFDPATGQLLTIPPPPPLPPPRGGYQRAPGCRGADGSGRGSPPDVSAQGPGRWDHPSDTGPLWPGEATAGEGPVPATTLQPPYRSEYDGSYFDATGRASRQPTRPGRRHRGSRARRPSGADVPGQAVAGHLVLAAAAVVVAMVAHILELTLPDSPDNGAWKLNDFGTNLTVAGALTAVTMVLGAIAWCAGFRWGAGLAGGPAPPSPGGWPSPSGRPSWSSAEPSRHRWADRR